jgi:hypothetical protein
MRVKGRVHGILNLQKVAEEVLREMSLTGKLEITKILL